jgi:hypothetical protein
MSLEEQVDVQQVAVEETEPAPVRIGKRVFVSNLAWRTSWQVRVLCAARARESEEESE